MNPLFSHVTLTLGLLGLALAAPAASEARPLAGCPADEKALIESEAHCFSGAGVDIGFYGEDGLKVACMSDRQVQAACGPDGRLTRLHAYSEWFTKLKQFENSCNSRGGVFSFEDPNFTEPQNESFCVRAEPEVGTNMFEGSLCNYRSICPTVAVVCEYHCGKGNLSMDDSENAPQAVHATLAPLIPVQ